ncbi:RNA polymerase sigma factor [Singulisphaera sp. PoT]|uniref:RNA polymerase sigma factor n=1 Tax=Singulisphaera sp. PoT TaxID=3411797 RepID=UPI003BF4F59A
MSEPFDRTVRPLLDAMVATARRVLGDEGTAWDAVQEALISLWREEEMPPNPRAWLLRAVTLRSLHLARTRARRWKHEGRARRERPEACSRFDPSERLEFEEISKAMDQALAEIPAEYRDVLDLKTVAHMDYATIAETLQIPLGTVRSRLNRSRMAVRQILSRMLPHDDQLPLPFDRKKA